MEEQRALQMKRFLKAVLIGSAIVSVPLTIVTVVIAGFFAIDTLNGIGNPWTPFAIAAAPVVITVPIVVAATVMIGLPIHCILRRTQYATNIAYTFAGGAAGFMIPTLPMIVDPTTDTWWLALLGLVSGAATGHVWFEAGRSAAR